MVFYFTYGSDSDEQAHKGGWTEVEADNAELALAAYKAYYPPNDDGLLPYCWMYSEDEFIASKSFKTGNFGVGRHDVITLIREAP